MVWRYHGKQIPLEIYHGVPEGWYAHEIIAEHSRLGGVFPISGPVATEPGAPEWFPERFDWLQYRETLYTSRMASGPMILHVLISGFATSSCNTSAPIQASSGPSSADA